MGDIKRKPSMGKAYRTRDFVTPFHKYCVPAMCSEDGDLLEVEHIRERLRNYRPTDDETVRRFGMFVKGFGE